MPDAIHEIKVTIGKLLHGLHTFTHEQEQIRRRARQMTEDIHRQAGKKNILSALQDIDES